MGKLGVRGGLVALLAVLSAVGVVQAQQVAAVDGPVVSLGDVSGWSATR